MDRKQSAMKAITWRVVASTDTFLLVWIVTQFLDDVLLAGAIALLEIPTKLCIYYLHERAWVRWLSRKTHTS